MALTRSHAGARALANAFARDDRAATMVEFSLVSMVVFVLMFGAMDWSRYFYNRARLANAVRRGALYAATVPSIDFDSATIVTRTRAFLLGSATEQAKGTVAVTLTGTEGVDQRVQVLWSGFPLTAATKLVMKADKVDSVTAEFRREQP
jgi:Flp pilus assembly protein TadG